MQHIQHQIVTSYSHVTDAELERLCYSTFPNIPSSALEELIKRFGSFVEKYAPAAPKTQYK